MEKNTDNPTYSILNIREIEYYLKEQRINGTDLKSIIQKFKLEYNLFVEDDFAVLEIIFTVKYELDPEISFEGKELGHFIGSYSFKVVNYQKIFIDFENQENPNSFKIDKEFLQALLSVTISGLRGMIALRFSGTSLSKFILPIMDVRKLSESTNPTFLRPKQVEKEKKELKTKVKRKKK